MPSNRVGKTSKSPTIDTQTDTVHLRPFLGLAPGQYLTIFYALIVMALVFFICIYPSVRRPGSKLAFVTEPAGAAIRIDDVYIGQSPCTVFVPQGEHQITAVIPGFEAASLYIDGDTTLFARSLRRPNKTITLQLHVQDPTAALAQAASEFAAWSLAGMPDKLWQLPLLLSEAAWRLGPYIDREATNYRELLYVAARFARWPAQGRDLLRAHFIAGNSGAIVSPLSILANMQEIVGWASSRPASAELLEALVPANYTELLQQSQWYKNAVQPCNPPKALKAGERGIGLADLNFVPLIFPIIPEGGIATFSGADTSGGADRPIYIAKDLVSTEDWNKFLQENPSWSPQELKSLVQNNLTDGQYLQNFEGLPIIGSSQFSISWHAAKAYCAWLQKQLPASLAAYTVRLPYEKEWEAFARQAGELGLTGLFDERFQWCEDPWAHFPQLFADPKLIQMIDSPLKVLKGNAWKLRHQKEQHDGQKYLERAALYPETCSPLVGFRPVIAPKDFNGNF